MTELFESPLSGEELPVVARLVRHDWSARVLYQVERANEWVLTWTDGINVWYEEWHSGELALLRLAALFRAEDQGVGLVHQSDVGVDAVRFRDVAEDFLSRTVHDEVPDRT